MSWKILLPIFAFNKRAYLLDIPAYHTEFSFDTKFLIFNTNKFLHIIIIILGFGIQLNWRENENRGSSDCIS